MKLIRFVFFLFFFLVSPSLLFAATYYIDWVGGSDANNGTAKTTPWKRHAYMNGFIGSYSHSGGDQFIFKGGVTWPNSCFPISMGAGGSVGNNDYYGVDQTWYTGGSWSRPIFSAGGSKIGSDPTDNIFIWTNYYNNITIDNIEFTGLYWDATSIQAIDIAIARSTNIWIKNTYHHGWSHGTYASGTRDANTHVIGTTAGGNSGTVVENIIVD